MWLGTVVHFILLPLIEMIIKWIGKKELDQDQVNIGNLLIVFNELTAFYNS